MSRLRFVGLIVFVLAWSIVFLSPKMRYLFNSQMEAITSAGTNLFSSSNHRDVMMELLRKYPNDPRVLAEDIRPVASHKERMHVYDQLIRRYPNEEWLLLRRLRFSRIEWSFSASLEKPSKKPAEMSHAEIIQVLELAGQGERLNPQNSYYNWVQAACYFILRQDEKALSVLQEGACKTNFDDGVLSDVLVREQFLRLRGVLLLEDRVSNAISTLMPHYSWMRRMNKVALWHGVLAERGGKPVRALSIYGTQMHLASLMRKGPIFVISQLVAEYMEQDAWDAHTIDAQSLLVPDSFQIIVTQQGAIESAVRFANYARSQGRQDFADKAIEDARQSIRGKLSGAFNDYPNGIPSLTVSRISYLQRGGIILLKTCALSLLLWGTLGVVLWGIGLRLKEPVSFSWEVFSTTLFALIPFVVVTICSLLFYPNHEYILDVFTLVGNSEMRGLTFGLLSNYLPYMPVILVGTYCLGSTLWRGYRNKSFCLSDDFITKRCDKILLKIFLFTTNTLVLFYVCRWALAESMYSDTMYFVAFIPVLSIVVTFVLREEIIQRLLRYDIAYGFVLARNAIGAFIVIVSAVYLICSLTAVPLRNEADKYMDDFLKRGEVAMLRDRAVSQKP